MRTPRITLPCLVALLALLPATAWTANGTCGEVPGESAAPRMQLFLFDKPLQRGPSEPGLRVRVAIQVDQDGRARASGVVRIRDGSSNTVLMVEQDPAVVICGDLDGDRKPGLDELDFTLRDVRTGQLVEAVVRPDEEAEGPGRYPATLRLGGASAPSGRPWIEIQSWDWEVEAEI